MTIDKHLFGTASKLAEHNFDNVTDREGVEIAKFISETSDFKSVVAAAKLGLLLGGPSISTLASVLGVAYHSGLFLGIEYGRLLAAKEQAGIVETPTTPEASTTDQPEETQRGIPVGA